MTEADQPQTFSALSPETRLTYRALCHDEALYGDTLAIIRGCPTQEAAAGALERWIGEEESPFASGIYAQLLACALERVDWFALIGAFIPEDPRHVEDLFAREAYAPPAPDSSSVTHSLPAGE